MRTLLLGAMIGGLLAAFPVDLYGDALGGVNRSLDSADRSLENVDRTTERSKNVFDRIKGWFKQNRGNTPADPLAREVQQRLASLGFNPGPADGVVGPQTLDTILHFQQARGLPQDAQVTPEFAGLLRGPNGRFSFQGVGAGEHRIVVQTKGRRQSAMTVPVGRHNGALHIALMPAADNE